MHAEVLRTDALMVTWFAILRHGKENEEATVDRSVTEGLTDAWRIPVRRFSGYASSA
jgi:hypothetical protein